MNIGEFLKQNLNSFLFFALYIFLSYICGELCSLLNIMQVLLSLMASHSWCQRIQLDA